MARLRLFTLIVAAVGLAAGLHLFGMQWGIGITPDSITYYTGAKSLAAGDGFTRSGANGQVSRITSFPPGYSAVLASFEAMGLDSRRAAVPFHAVLLALNVTLSGVLAYVCAGGAKRATSAPLMGGAAALLVAGSTPLLEAHGYLWSEPLYLPLMLGSLVATAAALGKLGRRGVWPALWLAALGGALGAACYTVRYAGLSLLAYGGALLFAAALLRRRRRNASTLAKQLRSASLIACAYGAVPIGLLCGIAWRNSGAGSAAVGRQRGWHPPGAYHWDSFRQTVEDWFVPGGPFSNSLERPTRAALMLGAALLGLLVAVALAPVAQRESARVQVPAEWRMLGFVVAGYAAFYLLFLSVSITVYDFATYPDRRILLPAYVCLVIAGFGTLGRWRLIDGIGGPHAVATARCLVLIPLCLLSANTLAGGVKFSAEAHESGLGYGSRSWQELEIWDDLASLGSDVPLWSNAPDAIGLTMRGRRASRVPLAMDHTAADRQTPAVGLEQRLERLERSMTRESAVVVFFDRMQRVRWMYLNPEQLQEAMAVEPLLERQGAAIYIHRQASRYEELKHWAQKRQSLADPQPH